MSKPPFNICKSFVKMNSKFLANRLANSVNNSRVEGTVIGLNVSWISLICKILGTIMSSRVRLNVSSNRLSNRESEQSSCKLSIDLRNLPAANLTLTNDFRSFRLHFLIPRKKRNASVLSES